MILGNVERLEVAPAGLDLGALGYLVSEADEHVLERLADLGDEVQMPAEPTREHLGQIETVRGEPLGPRRRRKLLPTRIREGLEAGADLVQETASRSTLLGWHRPESLVHLRKTGLLRPESHPLTLVERGQITGLLECGRCRGLELCDLWGNVGSHELTRRCSIGDNLRHPQPAARRRRRAASKQRTATVMATFSDSVPASIGIVSEPSSRLTTSSGNPAPSLPSTSRAATFEVSDGVVGAATRDRRPPAVSLASQPLEGF